MKKLFLIVLLALFFSANLFSQQSKPIITVLDMETNGISESEMRTVISILSSALFKTGYFTVIDVSQRETVLKELEFSMSGCSDDSCMLEVGKLLSAEAVVVGKIGRIGNKFVISAKMLETETAKTISTADGLYPDVDTLLENIFHVAQELAVPYASEEKTVLAVTPQAETGIENETEPAAESATGKLNIPAIGTLAGGVVSAGVGAYFLAVSLPLIIDYIDAKSAYENETDEAADISSLWNNYEALRQNAIDGNANRNFVIGASGAGIGAVLIGLSVYLFGGGE